MAANNPKGTLQSAAGGVVFADKDSDDCKAWRAATKKWCDETRAHKETVKKWKAAGKPDPPGRPTLPTRKFNDYLFAARNDPTIIRELPLGATLSNGTNVSMTALKAGGGALGMGASAVLNAYRLASVGLSAVGGPAAAWDGVRNTCNQASGALYAQGARPFYPDGMRGGDAIEVKGPGDREGDGQYKKYADTAPSGKCVVIDPKSCDPNQELTTPGGRCRSK